MSFPGMGGGLPGGAPDPNDPNAKAIKMMSGMAESCYAKTIMSGVAGFGLGGIFGIFMASMAYDTPYHTAATAGASQMPNSQMPWKQQLKMGFKDMGSRSWSTAKNFAMVGALFTGIECGIEGYRAKNDIGNGVAAGCLSGAILARGSGPQGMAVGCAGFAAFSAAIDTWMRMPKDDE
ncbi:hypothetical protein VPNG_05699 [Cytospora leucostoma]|uniref:Mitochondrial import inner membrane translocase subunit TIM22 n=1 Tax=Cytospora leucostoma TaxID=1230097 RepID=A0A423X039_9PEZI|nr:hypothetical protein VPNG_05699 [Cytospora leucostoma]